MAPQDKFILLCSLLDEVRCSIEAIALTDRVSRVLHLNHNERILQGIRAQLDEAYRDFLAASALCVEAQQTEIALQQSKIAVQQHRLDAQQTRLAAQQADTHMTVRNATDPERYVGAGRNPLGFVDQVKGMALEDVNPDEDGLHVPEAGCMIISPFTSPHAGSGETADDAVRTSESLGFRDVPRRFDGPSGGLAEHDKLLEVAVVSNKAAPTRKE
ncbi:hypothetical protein B0H16DRAFT_1712902 [Mycena metata]|uniref:Uncharacterized protein n=1 Tax=Mycena metata TaxID=1033252 RepID=A0AAD7JZX7_9AGAR|nr:hypothetical protein B0H16DRAFT_1712902 [Mycena metata]